MNGTRILAIDDEPQIHRFLRPALETSGYAVERASTAAEGLAMARTRPPALILLDLGLPDMDGEDVQYLRVRVGHPRQKLGPAAARLLTTEPGVGCRLLDRAPAEGVA